MCVCHGLEKVPMFPQKCDTESSSSSLRKFAIGSSIHHHPVIVPPAEANS